MYVGRGVDLLLGVASRHGVAISGMNTRLVQSLGGVGGGRCGTNDGGVPTMCMVTCGVRRCQVNLVVSQY